RRARGVGTQEHGHGPQELGNVDEQRSSAAGAACKDEEARKTRMAAPVSFGLWISGLPAILPRTAELRQSRRFWQLLPRWDRLGVQVRASDRDASGNCA